MSSRPVSSGAAGGGCRNRPGHADVGGCDRRDRGVGLLGGERAVLERGGNAPACGPHAFAATDLEPRVDLDEASGIGRHPGDERADDARERDQPVKLGRGAGAEPHPGRIDRLADQRVGLIHRLFRHEHQLREPGWRGTAQRLVDHLDTGDHFHPRAVKLAGDSVRRCMAERAQRLFFGRDERDSGVVRRPSQNQSELIGRHGPARSAGNDHGNASNLACASIQDDLVKEARIAAARPHLALAQRPLGSRSQGEQQEVESHRIAIAGEQTALGLVDSCHSVRRPSRFGLSNDVAIGRARSWAGRNSEPALIGR